MMIRELLVVHICISAVSALSLHVGQMAKPCDTPYVNSTDPGRYEKFAVFGKPTHNDICFVKLDGECLLLDIYLPCGQKRNSKKRVPAMLYIHGGGWVYGEKGNLLKPVMRLLSKGIAVVSVDYRLVNDMKWGMSAWPAQGHDVVKATKWLKENAESYSINPDKVGCWGESAGGQLCAWLASAGALDDTTRMTVAVDMFGINCFFCDTLHDDFYFGFPSGRMAEVEELHSAALDANVAMKEKTSDKALLSDAELVRSAEPVFQVRYVSGNTTSPMFVAAGKSDVVVPTFKSSVLAQELNRANVTYEYIEVPHGDHSYVDWPEEIVDKAIAFAGRFLQ